ncbi:hypothetical protein GQ53DRAFT_817840 [Thozetella sp. PMI_491]|nr:hypothetical protein GQ53DRAFT_817840 [Thozetella sp. PMI_491]
MDDETFTAGIVVGLIIIFILVLLGFLTSRSPDPDPSTKDEALDAPILMIALNPAP